MGKKESDFRPPSRAQLTREFRSGKLLGTLFGKHSRGWGCDDKVVAAICDAHNEGHIDVLSIVTDDTLAATNANVFFQGQTLYCSLIPKLNADAGELARVVRALIRAGGADGAAGLPANSFANWCEVRPERPQEVVALVDNGNEDAAAFLTPALRIGAANDREYFLGRAHHFALKDENIQCRAAVRALGQIKPETPEEWARLVETLTSVAVAGDDLLSAAVIEAAAGQLKLDDGAHLATIEGVIKVALATEAGENRLHQCADTLWMQARHISPTLRTLLLAALLEVDPKNRGTINHIDYGLTEILKAGGRKEVMDFLEQLIVRHKRAIKLKWFDSVCRAVHEADGGALHDWVVGWFLTGNYDLCSQAAHAFFGVECDSLVLDIDFRRFELSEADYPYLARKAIGFLFLKPLIATSIILSLVRSAPTRVAAEIEKFLFDPMLLNYAGVDRKLLRGVAKNRKDTAHAAAKRALARIEKYLGDLASADPIRELHPSERQRQMEWQRSADAMGAARQKADGEKSSLANLFSKVLLLHGKRSISYHRIGKEEPRRIEAKMSSHSFSYEMPRIEIADPVGLQRMLLSCRAERRPK